MTEIPKLCGMMEFIIGSKVIGVAVLLKRGLECNLDYYIIFKDIKFF